MSDIVSKSNNPLHGHVGPVESSNLRVDSRAPSNLQVEAHSLFLSHSESQAFIIAKFADLYLVVGGNNHTYAQSELERIAKSRDLVAPNHSFIDYICGYGTFRAPQNTTELGRVDLKEGDPEDLTYEAVVEVFKASFPSIKSFEKSDK